MSFDELIDTLKRAIARLDKNRISNEHWKLLDEFIVFYASLESKQSEEGAARENQEYAYLYLPFKYEWYHGRQLGPQLEMYMNYRYFNNMQFVNNKLVKEPIGVWQINWRCGGIPHFCLLIHPEGSDINYNMDDFIKKLRDFTTPENNPFKKIIENEENEREWRNPSFSTNDLLLGWEEVYAEFLNQLIPILQEGQ